MAYADFLPARETELLGWSDNFDQKINQNPQLLGLTPQQAASYAALNLSFADAYRAAINPSTRTPTAIMAKNEAKEALTEAARRLAAIIQTHPETTDPLRVDLRLTVRRTEGSSIPSPVSQPTLWVRSSKMRTSRIIMRDSVQPFRRAKPHGVAGALVLMHVGDEAPENLQDWSYCCTATRPEFTVNVPARHEPGARLWLTAMWFNRKGQTGRPATPVSTRIGDGV